MSTEEMNKWEQTGSPRPCKVGQSQRQLWIIKSWLNLTYLPVGKIIQILFPTFTLTLLCTHSLKKICTHTSTFLERQASFKTQNGRKSINTSYDSALDRLPLRRNEESADNGLQEAKTRAKRRKKQTDSITWRILENEAVTL